MKGLSNILQFVIFKYDGCKTHETDKNAQENAWITDTNMQPEDLEAVKQFIMSKEGCSEEKARGIFLNERDNVLNGRAKLTGDFFSKITLVLVSVLLFFLLAVGKLAERPSPEGLSALIEAMGSIRYLVGILLFCSVYFVCWKPRLQAKNNVWEKCGNMQEKLEKLYEIENMPFIKLVIKHQRAAILIFLAICLHIAVMTSVLQLVNNDKNDNEQAFQSAMAGITVSQDCRGTRYAVYDTAEEKYVLKYLKEEHLAQTAEDVCAVIRIEHKEKQVKQYTYTEHKYAISADAYGYRRYLVISLIDQKTGETVGVAHVFGEEPPDEVRIETSKRSSEKPKVYGTDPDENEITEKCYSLIEQFEEQRDMLDP